MLRDFCRFALGIERKARSSDIYWGKDLQRKPEPHKASEQMITQGELCFMGQRPNNTVGKTV